MQNVELDSCLMYHLIASFFRYQYFEDCYFGKRSSILKEFTSVSIVTRLEVGKREISQHTT